ncbi:RCC1 domain-containing protein [Candidatus Riflebacteria bacterium]
MNRNYFFLFFLLSAMMVIGCNILSNDDDDTVSIPQTTTISGKVEFPESAGTVGSIKGSIRAKVDFNKYRIWINDVRFILHDDGTYTAQLTVADEYDIQVRFAGSNNAILRAIATPDDTTGTVPVDVLTTAVSLAYIAYTAQAGQSANFQTFEELVDEADEVIQELAAAIETALQSVENLESEDFNLEEDENVQAKTDDAVEKAEEEEEKQAASSTTTSSTTTSTAEVDTTTTSSSTSSTTAVELPAGTLAINDGAATADSVNVILNLTVTQAVGVITMSVDGGDFEALNMAKSHTLSSGDGDKTVTIILKDDNGLSESITDTIKLETTPPPPAFTGKVAAGEGHALCIKSDKTIWAQGYNSNGQVGDGTKESRFDWVQVGVQGEVSVSIKAATGALTDTIDTAAGYYHSLALKSDGTVWGWGDNNQYAQLGGGYTMSGGYAEDQKLPVQVGVGESGDVMRGSIRARIMTDPAITDVTAIAAGYYHSLALKSDGTVWSWGFNNYGQTGTTGSGYYRFFPSQISGISGLKAITAGKYHSLALKSDGTVWAWGYNNYGQLGDGTYVNRNSPVQVGVQGEIPPSSIKAGTSALTEITAIAAGEYHSLALKADGTVWSWGNGNYGQLGWLYCGSSPSKQNTPALVTNLSDVSSIACGNNHSLAQKSDGTVWGWGYNGYGQIEEEWTGSGGKYSNENTAVQIQVSNVVAMNGGYGVTVFLLSDDSVKLFGNVMAGATPR